MLDLKRLLKILAYSKIFPNIIEQINFIFILKLSPETEFKPVEMSKTISQTLANNSATHNYPIQY